MKNQVALITEGGNGLGKQFAAILSEHDIEVILVAEERYYHQLKKEALGATKVLEVDITKTESLQKLYDYLNKVYGRLDILVNNAEMANGFGQKIEQIDLADFKAVFEVNFFAVLRTIKMLHPLLMKSKKAHIVNITSGLGQTSKMKEKSFCYSDYQMTAYSTSKAALEMLTVLLSKELDTTPIKIDGFDPVRMKNCTYNSVTICNEVKKALLQLLEVHQMVDSSSLP